MTSAKELNRQLRDANIKFGRALRQIPRAEWPAGKGHQPAAVWRSRDFLVQVYDESGHARISVNRTVLGEDGRFADGISWDDLQAIKNTIGYAEFDAVELYPAIDDVVNVANLRHLWVLPAKAPFGWRHEAPKIVDAHGQTWANHLEPTDET